MSLEDIQKELDCIHDKLIAEIKKRMREEVENGYVDMISDLTPHGPLFGEHIKKLCEAACTLVGSFALIQEVCIAEERQLAVKYHREHEPLCPEEE